MYCRPACTENISAFSLLLCSGGGCTSTQRGVLFGHPNTGGTPGQCAQGGSFANRFHWATAGRRLVSDPLLHSPRKAQCPQTGISTCSAALPGQKQSSRLPPALCCGDVARMVVAGGTQGSQAHAASTREKAVPKLHPKQIDADQIACRAILCVLIREV